MTEQNSSIPLSQAERASIPGAPLSPAVMEVALESADEVCRQARQLMETFAALHVAEVDESEAIGEKLIEASSRVAEVKSGLADFWRSTLSAIGEYEKNAGRVRRGALAPGGSASLQSDRATRAPFGLSPESDLYCVATYRIGGSGSQAQVTAGEAGRIFLNQPVQRLDETSWRYLVELAVNDYLDGQVQRDSEFRCLLTLTARSIEGDGSRAFTVSADVARRVTALPHQAGRQAPSPAHLVRALVMDQRIAQIQQAEKDVSQTLRALQSLLRAKVYIETSDVGDDHEGRSTVLWLFERAGDPSERNPIASVDTAGSGAAVSYERAGKLLSGDLDAQETLAGAMVSLCAPMVANMRWNNLMRARVYLDSAQGDSTELVTEAIDRSGQSEADTTQASLG